jgi:hypothetical protein
MSDIPIVIISYNNYKFVQNTLKQILGINKDYYNNIIILDNCSNDKDTINYLQNVNVKIINNSSNPGPWISQHQNKHIYDILPSKFILTDPDLELNENIPTNFIEILADLSDKYNCRKIGFALDINEPDKMLDTPYFTKHNTPQGTIRDWELQFWKYKINDEKYELYYADIDTTFCLINKNNIYSNNTFRIAGNFTAKHLPWYVDCKVYSLYESYSLYNKSTKISTISDTLYSYINNNYLKVNKNDEYFFIKKDKTNPNLTFWENNYTNWENNKFSMMDKYLDTNKRYIEIGAKIGATAIYANRKSKHVYSVEDNIYLYNDMVANFKVNYTNSYTLINKDISINNIIDNYDMTPNDISLINIDIDGKEENILFDLYNMHTKYNFPILININYDKWENKNLERFDFLTLDQKNNIITCKTNIIFEI